MPVIAQIKLERRSVFAKLLRSPLTWWTHYRVAREHMSWWQATKLATSLTLSILKLKV